MLKNNLKIIFLILCFPGFYLQAQVTFKATANKVVEVGENFRLNLTVNANGSGFKPPSLGDFSVLAGPSTSTSSSFQYINGKTSQTIANTYSYILQARKEGTFTIGSAEITVDGTTYKSNPLSIEVIKGSSNATNIDPGTNNQNVPSGSPGKGDIFVRTNLSKSTVYQGEQLVATLKIYDKNRDLKALNDVKFPSFAGFWTQEIKTANEVSLERENVNNKIYYTAVLRQSILFPQKSGTLTVEPFELECIVQELAGQRRNFFGEIVNVYNDVVKKFKSNPGTIKVLPLPENKPASFTGAVGTNFSFDVNVDRKELKSNESITLKVTIAGSGNMQIIDKININFPASFEVFDPKVSSNISNTGGGAKGSKTYEYLVIPREPGNYNIPPIEFSYFDINTKSYKTLSSKELDFKIEKGDNSQTVISNQGYNKEEVQAIGSDIRFIVQDDFKLQNRDHTFFGSTTFYLFYIISLVVFLLTIILLRKQIKQNQNVVLQKNKRANKISRKRLKEAAIHMKQGNKEAFYNEVIRALWGYLGDKLNIPVADLSRDSVKEILTSKNINVEIINSFIEAIDNCEFAKYAPVSANNQIEIDYEKARLIINKLVNVLS